MKIDDDLLRDYIANPSFCPHCRSEQFAKSDSSYDDNLYWLYLRCDDCGTRWTEEYVLRDAWIDEPAD